MIIDTKYFYYNNRYCHMFYFQSVFCPFVRAYNLYQLRDAGHKRTLLYIPNPDCTHKYEVEVSSIIIMVYGTTITMG